MYKTILLLSAILAAAAPVRLHSQSFDTSGTAGLTGSYLFRYVDSFNDASGDITESCSLTGVITFDGAGNYTLSNTQLYDSAGTNGAGTCSSIGGGTYGVQSNGIAQLDTPIFGGIPGTLFGTFSAPVITASSTEDDYFDLFIAVQAPSASVTDSSLSGAFTVGTLDFPNASATLARQGYFTLNADGSGNINAFTITGSTANVTSGYITQNVAASTYSLSGTTGGTLTFPVTYNPTDLTQMIGGTKVLYVSADGNWLVGGSATGADMIFGFRAPSGTVSNSLLSGTYFIAGMEDYLPNNFLDAFYGSINTNGNGTLIWHERYDDVVDESTYDYTTNIPITLGSSGTYYDGSYYTYLAGANGEALMLIGSGQQFSLIVGVHAPNITPTSTIWIDPVGVTNAANYTPITNAFAPGELVNLYGSFGVPLQVDSVLPIPTVLGGVQVMVNGTAAPVLVVSENQLSVWVPYEVSGDYFATFQAIVNGSKSNSVTVYVDNSAPGIYTLAETGIGAGAILHLDYSLVTDSSPAKPGETVQLFMNGLGTVTPTVADGAAAPSDPLSNADETADLVVYLDDGVDTPAQANVLFAGLAPGLSGLYQVDFTVPSSGLANGDVTIDFNTLEALTQMATISVSGFSQTNARAHAQGIVRRHSAHRKAPKTRKRARGIGA